MYNRVKRIYSHVICQQILQSMAAKNAPSVVHYGKSCVQIGIVTEHFLHDIIMERVVLEERVAALEGGVAGLAVASGAAAVTYAITNIANAGDHVVASKTIYGGTYNLLAHTLSKFGITTTFVDPDDYEALEAAIKDNTKLVYIETLGNPNSNISDIERSADIAHRHGLPLLIDNTFGTLYKGK